jgi:D-arabinose 1-dehydrogenase-like Zn-dependent alcohol dehydrogenase
VTRQVEAVGEGVDSFSTGKCVSSRLQYRYDAVRRCRRGRHSSGDLARGEVGKQGFRGRRGALVTPASSSVGLAVIQIIEALGDVSIARTRTSAKQPMLLEYGADFAILSSEEPV